MWLEEVKEFLYRLTPKISFSPEPNRILLFLGYNSEHIRQKEVLEMVEKIAIKKGESRLLSVLMSSNRWVR